MPQKKIGLSIKKRPAPQNINPEQRGKKSGSGLSAAFSGLSVKNRRLIAAALAAAVLAAAVIAVCFAAVRGKVNSEVRDFMFEQNYYKTSAVSVKNSLHLHSEDKARLAVELGDTDSRGIIKVKAVYAVGGRYGDYVGLIDLPEENSLKGDYFLCTVISYTLRGEKRFKIDWANDFGSREELKEYCDDLALSSFVSR